MTDEYVLMCKDSPVQKEWKPSTKDGGQRCFSTDRNEIFVIDSKSPWHRTDNWIWLPRQEDWQDILDIKDVVCSESPHNFIQENTQKVTEYLGYCSDVSQKLVISKVYTILWCLFVHREVYGLEWDWEKKKWVKE